MMPSGEPLRIASLTSPSARVTSIPRGQAGVQLKIVRQRQSGKYQGQIKISKLGNAALRAALFMPARCAKRHNPLVQNLVTRMKAEGHCANAITVAVMRKLLHFVYGVLKSQQPFDPDYLVKQGITP